MAHYQSVSMLNRAGPNGHRHRKSASWRNIFLGFDLWNAVREKSKRDGQCENLICRLLKRAVLCSAEATQNAKSPPHENEAGSCQKIIPAATYSPTHLRMQYHRRWQA